MKKIKLTKGMSTVVDDQDYETLSLSKWYYSHGYAMRDTSEGRVYLHRLINSTPANMDTDHINRNRLDNRRANLRTASRSANKLNINPPSNNTSGHVGVTWFRRDSKWKVQIKKDGINHHIGYYADINDAIKARKEAESKYE